MSQITISKGKVLKEDVEITYAEMSSNVSKPIEITAKSKNTPHPDLKKAFAALTVHAAILAEFIPSSAVSDPDEVDPALIKNYSTSGFSLSGTDNEHVILTAQRTLSTGRPMTFNIPTNLSDKSDKAYVFTEKLLKAIEICKDRLRDYLNGTFGDPIQQEIDFGKSGKNKATKIKVAPDLTPAPDKEIKEEVPSFNDSPSLDGQSPVKTTGRKRKVQTPDNPSGAE